MPFAGLSPFLHFPREIAYKDIELCQCPSACSLHFYLGKARQLKETKSGCQCPLAGFLHFYESLISNGTMAIQACQCPLTGSLHFYLTNTGKYYKGNDCVNALSQALSISTQKCEIVVLD